jgi:hypothetical protein
MQGVEFVDRETGWRHRGRPRRPVDPEIVALLKRTYDTGTAARVPLDADTTAEDVRETIANLRRAAAHMRKYLRIQPRRTKEILAEGVVRFYVEDAA